MQQITLRSIIHENTTSDSCNKLTAICRRNAITHGTVFVKKACTMNSFAATSTWPERNIIADALATFMVGLPKQDIRVKGATVRRQDTKVCLTAATELNAR